MSRSKRLARALLLACGLLWLESPAQAAIAYVNSNSISGGVSGASASFGALTFTAGNLDVVTVRWTGAAITSTAPTDTAGDTFVQVGADLTLTGNDHQALWYAANLAGGSTTVTVNFSGSATAIYAAQAQYSGLATSSPVDAAPTANVGHGTSVTSNSFSTTQASELIVTTTGSAAGASTNITPSGTSGTYTRRVTDVSFVVGIGDFIASSTQSGVTTTWTGTATDFFGNMTVTFKAPGGGGTPGCKNGLLLMGAGCDAR